MIIKRTKSRTNISSQIEIIRITLGEKLPPINNITVYACI